MIAFSWLFVAAAVVLTGIALWLEPDPEVDEAAPMIRSFRASWESRGRQVKPQ